MTGIFNGIRNNFIVIIRAGQELGLWNFKLITRKWSQKSHRPTQSILSHFPPHLGNFQQKFIVWFDLWKKVWNENVCKAVGRNKTKYIKNCWNPGKIGWKIQMWAQHVFRIERVPTHWVIYNCIDFENIHVDAHKLCDLISTWNVGLK